MFKKILICAVSMTGLFSAHARADDFYPMHRHPAYAHSAWMHRGAHYWRAPRATIHPTVVRGYYGPGFASDARVPYRGIDPYAPLGPQTLAYPPNGHDVYNQPIVAYSSATALVPVTTYAPVPVRVYYIPQQEPYYNVPPYVVRAPCFCN